MNKQAAIRKANILGYKVIGAKNPSFEERKSKAVLVPSGLTHMRGSCDKQESFGVKCYDSEGRKVIFA